MKKALLATFSFITLLIFLLIFFSLYGREVRHTEISNALNSSMKQAILHLQLDEGGPVSKDEWLHNFSDSIASQIQSKSDLTIHIYEADFEKGLLSAEAILTFRNPIGTYSSVTTGKQTIILEEYYVNY